MRPTVSPVRLRASLACALLFGCATANQALAQPAVPAPSVPAAKVSAPALPAGEQHDAKFHARIVKLYNFTPHTMPPDKVTAKVKELDAFWAEVKADSARMVPWVRAELKDARTPAYFAFDGAKMLMTLSKTPADQAIALQALPRADLRDADNAEYFLAVHWFARNGLDVLPAAFHILDYPDFRANNVGKAMNLDQAYAFIFTLFPLPENRFVPALAARLSVEKDGRAHRALLLALWYSATPEGRRALEEYVADAARPAEGRELARKLLAEKVPPRLPPGYGTEEELRELRRKAMTKIEPLALHSLDTFTAQIYFKQQNPNP